MSPSEAPLLGETEVPVSGQPQERAPTASDVLRLVARFSRSARGQLVAAVVLAVGSAMFELLPYWVIYRLVFARFYARRQRAQGWRLDPRSQSGDVAADAFVNRGDRR